MGAMTFFSRNVALDCAAIVLETPVPAVRVPRCRCVIVTCQFDSDDNRNYTQKKVTGYDKINHAF